MPGEIVTLQCHVCRAVLGTCTAAELFPGGSTVPITSRARMKCPRCQRAQQWQPARTARTVESIEPKPPT